MAAGFLEQIFQRSYVGELLTVFSSPLGKLVEVDRDDVRVLAVVDQGLVVDRL